MRTLLLLTLAPASLLAQAIPDSSRASRDSTATILETVTVTAIRARDEAPISAHAIGAREIERRSFGQDVPLLLQGTPSLTSYSETGNYWGYSYMRLRGIDQSRINLTIDGIPLNDPEDQVLYFADFPDLANSIGSVQIQRGVGTSAPGTASYGGSINFQTTSLLAARRAGELQLQGGSFGTRRASAEYASGLTRGGLAVYGRLSALQSNGYRHHSGMEGRSGLLSAAWVGERDLLKLTAIAGLFADTLAYVGASRGELAQNRRFNPLRHDEVDRFGEQVVALAYTRQLGAGSSASATAYRLSAGGSYKVCISNCDQPQGDLWNFNLDFTWYGVTTAWNLERDRFRASVGLNANTYERDHYALPDGVGSLLYFNTGHKDDASVFAKLAYDVGRVTLFGDVHARRAVFAYEPDPNAGITRTAIGWTFLNPKAGVTFRVDPSLDAYASVGMNAREPARSDMFAGLDNLDSAAAAFVGPFDRVRPERAHDLEAGVRMRRARWTLAANAFAMEFRNEILPVGQLSYIGTPLRTNVRRSWRRGAELDLTARPAARVEVALTATAMRGRIDSFTDDNSGQSYHGVEPLLTPKLTASHRLTLGLTPQLSLSTVGQYSARSYLTNTAVDSLTLPASYVLNAALDWTRGRHGVALHVNNATNSRRFGGGHVAGNEPRFYVLPPVNLFLIAKVRL
jgi:iron complex outermembrane recepter protein